MVEIARADGAAIEVAGLTHRFGGREVVSDVSFTAAPGRVTGFLGPNGAGKTTTLKAILGLLAPTAGVATIAGTSYRDLPQPMTRVGASLEATAQARSRSGLAHLRCYAPLANATAERVDELLALVGLAEHARRPVGSYSLGMHQRLALATALLGDPDVLILDEPANGLDPPGVHWLRSFLRGFAASGRTVLLSSHMLAEMQLIADDVVLIDRGEAVFVGTLHDLLDQDRTILTAAVPAARTALVALLEQHGGLRELEAGRMLVEAPIATVRGWAVDLVTEQPSLVGAFGVERLDLETAFLLSIRGHEGAAP